MDFKKQYVLENEIALLRSLSEDDFEALLYFSINEPQL